MAAKLMFQLLKRLRLRVDVHRMRRGFQIWRAFKEYETWQEERKALVRLQARVRGAVSRIRLARYLLRCRMAIRIQSIVRMRIAMKQLEEAKYAATQIQKEMRRFIQRRYYLVQRAAIVRIQGTFLSFHHWRRFLRCQWAASVISRNVRWWRIERLIRQHCNELLKLEEQRYQAAARIQRTFRGHRDRVFVRKILQSKHKATTRYFDAAVTIQRVWYNLKGFAGRFALCCALRAKHMDDLYRERMRVLWLRMHVASKLQAVFRGKIARRRALRVKRRIDSSCDIQRVWRGWVARLRYARYQSRKYAAVSIQKWIRGVMRARHDAARVLQSWYWRVLVRVCSRVYQIRQRQIDSKTMYLIRKAQRVRDAALSIQCFMRYRWACRVSHRLECGRLIVAVARGHLDRKRVCILSFFVSLFFIDPSITHPPTHPHTHTHTHTGTTYTRICTKKSYTKIHSRTLS